MTGDEKICPFMSRPVVALTVVHRPDAEDCGSHALLYNGIFKEVQCLKERCMAWVEDCPEYKKDDPRECHPEDCEMENRDYKRCKGGCRLI